MSESNRSIGVDVGDVRIGVALSDPLGIIAQPHSVVQTQSPQQDAAAIARIAAESGARRIVVGMPLNREGKPGPQAEKVLAFVEVLRQTVDVEIILQDERFSTASAERALIDAGVRREKRKRVIDKVAAQRILQTYLDRRAHESRTDPQ
ncbi:MAG: hypothetical protein AMXMBFR4_08740 [Candidatus Hydrogenedentota bacterium]